VERFVRIFVPNNPLAAAKSAAATHQLEQSFFGIDFPTLQTS